jgi:hypothetical protein
MLMFVLRDGLEYCEWQVRESLASDMEANQLGTTPHETVMREARARIESARRRQRGQAA